MVKGAAGTLGQRGAFYRRIALGGARMTMAAVTAYALVYVLGLREGLWAVITAVIVAQSSVGGSLKVAFEQLVGSLFGAIYATGLMLLIAPEIGRASCRERVEVGGGGRGGRKRTRGGGRGAE